jgi:hypothetical protein
VKLTGPDRREGVEDLWHERLEVHHAIRRGTHQEHANRHGRQVLLELDAAVHREEDIVVALHAPQKLAVRDTGPAAADDGINRVAWERGGEIERKLLVKKNAHRPAV